MAKTSLGLISAIIVLVCSALLVSAQTSPPQHPTRTKVREEPCWQKVGITQEVKDQRDQIARDTRSQVEQVCADSSLNDQQKKQKIHEIHQDAKQKSQGLMSPQQLEELQACQKERAGSHPTSAGMQHGGGPCAEFNSPTGNHAAGNSGAENH
jgi:Spy/CpxP family protein refolding chaperone